MHNRYRKREIHNMGKCIPGSFVQLIHADWENFLPKNLYGVIDHQDESGKVHVVWENGSKSVLDQIDENFIFCKPPQAGRKRITVLVIEADKEPYECRIAYDFHEYQKLVGGHVEMLPLYDGCTLYCNEEGRINGLPGNRKFDNGEVICGTFVIGAGEKSLSPAQREKYYYRFLETEHFNEEEIHKDSITVTTYEDDIAFFRALMGISDEMER